MTLIYMKSTETINTMENVHFEPRINGDFVYETDENGNKVVKEIKNMNIISIDMVSGTIFD